MKRIFAAMVLSALLLTMAFSLTACQSGAETDELVVYNWADYIYPEYEEEFSAYYKELTGRDIRLTYVTFDTNETMLTKILKGDSVVDVMCPSEYAIQKLLEQDLLIPLYYFDEERFLATDDLNDYEHFSGNVDANIVGKIEEGFGNVGAEGVSMINYFVPYMYGTLGILYNKVFFDEIGIYDAETLNAANWGILFNDDGSGNVLSEQLTGRIYMKDSVRDGYAATVFYLAERQEDNAVRQWLAANADATVTDLINLTTDEVISACFDALVAQKAHLYGYEVDFGKNELLKSAEYTLQGNLTNTYPVVDLAWSGDAIYAVEESYDEASDDYVLSYYVPHGTGNIWFDGWVIPKTCRHEQATRIFINFLNRADIAAKNMAEIGYSAAVSPDAVLADEEALEALFEAYEVTTEEEKADFIDEFFYYEDEIDGSNWRYPFTTLHADRAIDSLGVMHDFGEKNTQVVTMWESVRAVGVNALSLLLWTFLVVAGAALVIFLIYLIRSRRKMYVKIRPEKEKTE